MYRRVFQQLGLAVVVLAMAPMAFGAESAPREQIAIPEVAKVAKTVLLDVDDHQPVEAPVGYQRISLGSASSTSIAPGVVVGNTWYDQMHNGSMGRMINWGINAEYGFRVHMSWMYLPDPIRVNRKYAYNAYDAIGDSLLGESMVQPDGEYAGYVVLDVTNENRAVLAGSNNLGWGLQTQLYWWQPGLTPWGLSSRIPDSVAEYGGFVGQPAIWPKFRYQDVPGQTPITHVFAHVDWGMPQNEPCMYIRKVGNEETGVWEYPPYVVDTVANVAQDITCSNTDGKVALVWTAMLPPEGECDTCSYSGSGYFYRLDNDVYYQVSLDYGATWEPRVNLTRYERDEPGYRAFTDLSALITSDNNLHIAYNAIVHPWSGWQCRMFHWGENLGLGGFDANGDAIFTTAASLEWDQTTCNGGVWQLNGSKMSLSECDGKLYYLWTQFNDIPNGVEDDCHERAWGAGDWQGSANGELYLAVSSDGGATWDMPRNLTNTYTPHCDPVGGVGGRCQSEHWASMAPFGVNIPMTGSNYEVIDPSGGYAGDWFLDVQYIDDADPGSIAMYEGTWTLNDVRWFRLACVEPVPAACLTSSVWGVITHTLLGVELSMPLVLENVCNLDANFTLTIRELNGPEGWLTTSGFESGVVPAGGGQLEGTFTMNTGGIVSDPGVFITLLGGLIFEGDFVGSPLEIPIRCDVIPEIYELWPDTIETNCLSLVLLANGNFGNQGAGKVNMDFFNSGDCDDLEGQDDTIPGDATIYVYDGSPVICWPDGDSVLCNWSIFGTGPTNANGFLPVSYEEPVDSGDFYFYQSEFITRDSGIGVRQSWYAPKDQPDSCQFLIHRLRVFSYDEQTHTNLAIGEIIDWDIPADTAIRNNSGFDPGNRLIFQQGSEYNDDDDVECMNNDDRYGGISLVLIMGEGEIPSEYFHGAFSADNTTQVYPFSGLEDDSVWTYMETNEGMGLSDSTDADLHTVMTYRFGHTLAAGDTLDITSVLATSMGGYADFTAAVQAGHQWSYDHFLPEWSCCVGIRGNVDYDPEDLITISDLVFLVEYMFGVPLPPECFEEADINGDLAIDISDLVWLVDYMFTGGPPPVACP